MQRKFVDLTQFDDERDVDDADDVAERAAADMEARMRANDTSDAADAEAAVPPDASMQKSVADMARALGVRYVGAIDPGTRNCAVCVFDIDALAIVYWRILDFEELRPAYTAATGVVLAGASNVQDANVHVVTWWMRTTPAMQCVDLLVIERQSFSREMCAMQAAFHAAFLSMRYGMAVDAEVTLAGGRKARMHVPRCLIVSADAVKMHFRPFFGMDDERQRHSSKPVWARGKRSATEAFGMGDANRADVSKEQYVKNKTNSKRWGQIVAATPLAMSNFDCDVRTGEASDAPLFMTAGERTRTLEDMQRAKTDDLCDAMFMTLYAVDALLPRLYLRTLDMADDKRKRKRTVLPAYKIPGERTRCLNHTTLLEFMERRAYTNSAMADAVAHVLRTNADAVVEAPRLVKAVWKAIVEARTVDEAKRALGLAVQ